MCMTGGIFTTVTSKPRPVHTGLLNFASYAMIGSWADQNGTITALATSKPPKPFRVTSILLPTVESLSMQDTAHGVAKPITYYLESGCVSSGTENIGRIISRRHILSPWSHENEEVKASW
jgi:hypothetical protein